MFKWFKKKKSAESKSSNGPDFNDIDSNDKAFNLFKKGELTKIHLIPVEFGGEDSNINTLYVPEFVSVLKMRFDQMIEDLLIEGKELSYSANPEYKGKSFIPSALKISVTGDSEFTEVIEIW
ncbi:hypothetical protein F7018_14895 [Tenacibaculum aiptasiae]|uniref:Uncharacterized protein n=1 Tax=Tenacibaculum aiptasiae TaxID=426481 RepID=A0A7J5A9R6_9FLAO|nr:hypothetical protein [Tenacibaculum aiptasiae]KAB1154255.1 hypothetical protein F7018_14895 [Tenacibaculum aiptasiae]